VAEIYFLEPDHGKVGDNITIHGDSFEGVRGTGHVDLGELKITPFYWSNTTVRFVVPSFAVSGMLYVTTRYGDQSLGVPFTVDIPVTPVTPSKRNRISNSPKSPSRVIG
jgi:hypothetical protein